MANRWEALAIVFATRTTMGLQLQAVAPISSGDRSRACWRIVLLQDR
jgi:hypothetical protein